MTIEEIKTDLKSYNEYDFFNKMDIDRQRLILERLFAKVGKEPFPEMSGSYDERDLACRIRRRVLCKHCEQIAEETVYWLASHTDASWWIENYELLAAVPLREQELRTASVQKLQTVSEQEECKIDYEFKHFNSIDTLNIEFDSDQPEAELLCLFNGLPENVDVWYAGFIDFGWERPGFVYGTSREVVNAFTDDYPASDSAKLLGTFPKEKAAALLFHLDSLHLLPWEIQCAIYSHIR